MKSTLPSLQGKDIIVTKAVVPVVKSARHGFTDIYSGLTSNTPA